MLGLSNPHVRLNLLPKSRLYALSGSYKETVPNRNFFSA
jgi:hypothetical protein